MLTKKQKIYLLDCLTSIQSDFVLSKVYMETALCSLNQRIDVISKTKKVSKKK